MTKNLHWIIAIVVAVVALAARPAPAVLVAADDASQPVYDSGFGGGTNGGFGFDPWSFVGRENGFGFGGGFIATAPPHPLSIASGDQKEAFGIFGNSGGVGSAIRGFAPLLPGMTFSLDMDNQGIDGGGTVGFSLQNAGGGNLAEYYFIGGQSNYTVNALNVVGTTPGHTSGGMHLAFTLTGLNSFLLTIDTLANGIGVDNSVVGNLLNSGDQQIAQLRLFNANGGPDVYFNNLSIDAPAAVPELSAFVFGGLVFCLVGISYGVKVFHRRQMATKMGSD